MSLSLASLKSGLQVPEITESRLHIGEKRAKLTGCGLEREREPALALLHYQNSDLRSSLSSSDNESFFG